MEPSPTSATSIVGRLRYWWAATLLGVATIGSYGIAQYAIGVLIPEIAADTGWSLATLSGGFAVAVLAGGLVALAAGYLLDRVGSVAVLPVTLAAGSAGFLAASWATQPWQFLVTWGIGGAAMAGGLYYNVTMPIVSRLYPDRRATGLSVLTLLGALSSPIVYPLAGWLIDAHGWRMALRLLVVGMVACVAPAAFFVRTHPSYRPGADRDPSASVAALLRVAGVQRALLVIALASIGSSALLVHQVAAMQAAGLSIGLAAGFAGTRGMFQVPGRLILGPLVRALGVPRSLAICYGGAAIASLALLAATRGAAAEELSFFYAALGGTTYGMLSPLHGLFQADVYGARRLGSLTGVTTVIAGLAQAAGAWVAGLAVSATGGFGVALVGVIVVHAGAIAALAWQRSAAGRVVTVAE